MLRRCCIAESSFSLPIQLSLSLIVPQIGPVFSCLTVILSEFLPCLCFLPFCQNDFHSIISSYFWRRKPAYLHIASALPNPIVSHHSELKFYLPLLLLNPTASSVTAAGTAGGWIMHNVLVFVLRFRALPPCLLFPSLVHPPPNASAEQSRRSCVAKSSAGTFRWEK